MEEFATTHPDEVRDFPMKDTHSIAVRLADFLLAVLDSDQTSTY